MPSGRPKREREERGHPDPTGSGLSSVAKQEVSNDAAPRTDPPPPQSPISSPPSTMTFGFYVWTEVSMVLFYRFASEIQAAAVALASLAGDTERQKLRLAALEETLSIVWRVGKTHLPHDEQQTHSGILHDFIRRFMSSLRVALQAGGGVDGEGEGSPREAVEEAPAPSTAAAATVVVAGGGGGTQGGGHTNGVIDACRALEKVLEEHGFPDDEGGDASPFSGGLAQLVAETRQNTELHCYSYSERNGMSIPLLPRYEGEKRAEQDYDQARDGHVVTLPFPHPHPEVNTTVQLIEPKKRRPNLDEFRIFSHPKKTTTHGVEDFLVDEELNHRAFTVLRQHLDTHGSFVGLSPYARFLLWNVVLERNDTAFEKLLEKPATTLEARRRIEEARVALGARYAAFTQVRAAARDAAQRIGWYAVSAQWRDQAISRLEAAEDADWYLVGDVIRLGGQAVFPNYAVTPAVRALAELIVQKLDVHFSSSHHRDRDEAVPLAEVVRGLLLPLLLGEQPSLGRIYAGRDQHADGTGTRLQRERRRLKALMAKCPTQAPGTGPTHPVAGGPSKAPTLATHVCLCPSMVFPLQCLAEMLELCSLAQFAEAGLDALSARIVRADWTDEESLLHFLLQAEPLNAAIAPMVAIPKVYRDMVTGVQLMYHDKMVPTVVEAAKLAGERGLTHTPTCRYAYWKSLSVLFQEEDRQDDLLFLRVPPPPSTRDRAPCGGEVGLPLYTECVIERARRVWPEDLAELKAEEKQYATTHQSSTNLPS